MLRVLQTRRLVQPLKPFVRNYFIKPPKTASEPKDVSYKNNYYFCQQFLLDYLYFNIFGNFSSFRGYN